MLPGASSEIEALAGTFTRYWPSSAEIYLADGTPAAGTRFANKTLAATYQRILAESEAAAADRAGQIEAARLAWYHGLAAAARHGSPAHPDGIDVARAPNPGLLSRTGLP